MAMTISVVKQKQITFFSCKTKTNHFFPPPVRARPSIVTESMCDKRAMSSLILSHFTVLLCFIWGSGTSNSTPPLLCSFCKGSRVH